MAGAKGRGATRCRARGRPRGRKKTSERGEELESCVEASGQEGEDEDSQDFLKTGSKWIGKRVRRMILDDDGKEIGYGKGVVLSWLPASISDFYSEATGEPAPLFRIRFDEVSINDIRRPSSEMGYEDLEEFEVELAVKQYNEIKDPFSWYECRKENETPQQIAKIFGINVDALVNVNKRYYPALLRNSKLKDRTWLLIPPLHSYRGRRKPNSVGAERDQEQTEAESTGGDFGGEEKGRDFNSAQYDKEFLRRTRNSDKNALHFGKENTLLDQKSENDQYKSSCENVGRRKSNSRNQRQKPEPDEEFDLETCVKSNMMRNDGWMSFELDGKKYQAKIVNEGMHLQLCNGKQHEFRTLSSLAKVLIGHDPPCKVGLDCWYYSESREGMGISIAEIWMKLKNEGSETLLFVANSFDPSAGIYEIEMQSEQDCCETKVKEDIEGHSLLDEHEGMKSNASEASCADGTCEDPSVAEKGCDDDKESDGPQCSDARSCSRGRIPKREILDLMGIKEKGGSKAKNDAFAQRDAFGIFIYQPSDSSSTMSGMNGKHVRFANLLEEVVAEVEKRANETDGRWTRGLHKKTSDQIAEQHLKSKQKNKTRSSMRSILKPFKQDQREKLEGQKYSNLFGLSARNTTENKKLLRSWKEDLDSEEASTSEKSPPPGKIENLYVGEDIKCEICMDGQDEENLLLCDGCNKGFHIFCHQPALEEIPDGEWLCSSCAFVRNIECEVCRRRDGENELILCDRCDKGWHMKCLDPPLRCVPQEEWFCEACSDGREGSGKVVEESNAVKRVTQRKKKTKKGAKRTKRRGSSNKVRDMSEDKEGEEEEESLVEKEEDDSITLQSSCEYDSDITSETSDNSNRPTTTAVTEVGHLGSEQAISKELDADEEDSELHVSMELDSGNQTSPTSPEAAQEGPKQVSNVDNTLGVDSSSARFDSIVEERVSPVLVSKVRSYRNISKRRLQRNLSQDLKAACETSCSQTVITDVHKENDSIQEEALSQGSGDSVLPTSSQDQNLQEKSQVDELPDKLQDPAQEVSAAVRVDDSDETDANEKVQETELQPSSPVSESSRADVDDSEREILSSPFVSEKSTPAKQANGPVAFSSVSPVKSLNLAAQMLANSQQIHPEDEEQEKEVAPTADFNFHDGCQPDRDQSVSIPSTTKAEISENENGEQEDQLMDEEELEEDLSSRASEEESFEIIELYMSQKEMKFPMTEVEPPNTSHDASRLEDDERILEPVLAKSEPASSERKQDEVARGGVHDETTVELNVSQRIESLHLDDENHGQVQSQFEITRKQSACIVGNRELDEQNPNQQLSQTSPGCHAVDHEGDKNAMDQKERTLGSVAHVDVSNMQDSSQTSNVSQISKEEGSSGQYNFRDGRWNFAVDAENLKIRISPKVFDSPLVRPCQSDEPRAEPSFGQDGEDQHRSISQLSDRLSTKSSYRIFSIAVDQDSPFKNHYFADRTWKFRVEDEAEKLRIVVRPKRRKISHDGMWDDSNLQHDSLCTSIPSKSGDIDRLASSPYADFRFADRTWKFKVNEEAMRIRIYPKRKKRSLELEACDWNENHHDHDARSDCESTAEGNKEHVKAERIPHTPQPLGTLTEGKIERLRAAEEGGEKAREHAREKTQPSPNLPREKPLRLEDIRIPKKKHVDKPMSTLQDAAKDSQDSRRGAERDDRHRNRPDISARLHDLASPQEFRSQRRERDSVLPSQHNNFSDAPHDSSSRDPPRSAAASSSAAAGDSWSSSASAASRDMPSRRHFLPAYLRNTLEMFHRDSGTQAQEQMPKLLKEEADKKKEEISQQIQLHETKLADKIMQLFKGKGVGGVSEPTGGNNSLIGWLTSRYRKEPAQEVCERPDELPHARESQQLQQQNIRQQHQHQPKNLQPQHVQPQHVQRQPLQHQPLQHQPLQHQPLQHQHQHQHQSPLQHRPVAAEERARSRDRSPDPHHRWKARHPAPREGDGRGYTRKYRQPTPPRSWHPKASYEDRRPRESSWKYDSYDSYRGRDRMEEPAHERDRRDSWSRPGYDCRYVDSSPHHSQWYRGGPV